MARTEITSKRTARSKTFDNGDGTFTLETGGHAHHQKNGEFLDTDVNWTDATTKFGTGEYPFTIEFAKATRTLTMDFGGGDVRTMSPVGASNPTSIVKAGNTLTFVRLWTGVTLTAILTPEGIVLEFTKTATTFVNPSFTVTSALVPFTQGLSNPYYIVDGSLGPVTVPFTLIGSTLTYDLTSVPVGSVVR